MCEVFVLVDKKVRIYNRLSNVDFQKQHQNQNDLLSSIFIEMYAFKSNAWVASVFGFVASLIFILIFPAFFIAVIIIQLDQITNVINVNLNSLYTMKSYSLGIFALLQFIVLSQVNHDPIIPKIVPVHIRPQLKIIPSQHSFKQSIKGLGFQISGSVYESTVEPTSATVYNTSAYQPTETCKFYSSQLSLQNIQQFNLGRGLSIEKSLISQQQQILFLLVSDDKYDSDQNTTNRIIMIFDFNSSGYQQRNDSISIAELGLVAGQPDLGMFVKNDYLYISDGLALVKINFKENLSVTKLQILRRNSSVVVNEDFIATNQLLQFQIVVSDYSSGQTSIMYAWNSAIQLFSVSSERNQIVQQLQLLPPQGKNFQDVIEDNGNYFALAEEQLIVFKKSKSKAYQTFRITLQSQSCWKISKYQTTIHILCKEGGLNYVAELFYNQTFSEPKEVLRLNRYYTQIDDANLVTMFGDWSNPKLFISGDEQIMIASYGVNRQVLLDLNKPQKTIKLKGLGVQTINFVSQLSNYSSSFIVGVGTDYFALFQINETPPEIQCWLRDDSLLSSNHFILVDINSSSCFANGDIQQLQSICRTLIPFRLQLSLFEIDSSKGTTVSILVFLMLLVIVLFLLGCAFKCKQGRNKAFAQVQRQLQRLKNKSKKPKPI